MLFIVTVNFRAIGKFYVKNLNVPRMIFLPNKKHWAEIKTAEYAYFTMVVTNKRITILTILESNLYLEVLQQTWCQKVQ